MPYFISDSAEVTYRHCVDTKFACLCTGCTMCNDGKANVDFAVSLMLHTIYSDFDNYAQGSDTTVIFKHKMSSTACEAILECFPTIHLCGMSKEQRDNILRKRFYDYIKADFPSINTTHMEEWEIPCRWGAYTPIMRPGGNELYSILSHTYKCLFTKVPVTASIKPHDLSQFCLLSFVLNKQYLLDPNVLIEMWSGALDSAQSIIECCEPRPIIKVLSKLYSI